MTISEFQKYSTLDSNFEKNASKSNKNDLLTRNLYKKIFDFFMNDSQSVY